METRTKKLIGGALMGSAILLTVACLAPVGNGDGLTANNEVIPAIPPDTNLQFVYDNVISTTGCANCHSSTSHLSGISFASYQSTREAFFDTDTNPRLTTKAPTVHPTHRVRPGSLDSSYLYHKVSGNFSTPPKSTPDDKMPPGVGLNAAKLAIVRAWILRGAPL